MTGLGRIARIRNFTGIRVRVPTAAGTGSGLSPAAMVFAALLGGCSGGTVAGAGGTLPLQQATAVGPAFLRFAAPAAPKFKIYVVNLGNNTLTTYKPDGTQTAPTITAGLDYPYGVTVDANGKIVGLF